MPAATQRSETIGELGAVAKFEVPVAGAYTVKGSGDLPVGSASLEFGTNAGAAIADKWRLLAGLVGAAMLVTLIPVPRGRKYWGDEDEAPRGWSSDPRQPYAG